MTASTASRAPFDTLDARIARALGLLRQARLAATRSPNSYSLQIQTRAEENLNALLEYRYFVQHRSQ